MVKDLLGKAPKKDLRDHNLYAYVVINRFPSTVLDSQVVSTLQIYHLPALTPRRDLNVA